MFEVLDDDRGTMVHLRREIWGQKAVKKLRKTTEGTEDTEKNLILIRPFSVLSVFSVVKYRFFHSFHFYSIPQFLYLIACRLSRWKLRKC